MSRVSTPTEEIHDKFKRALYTIVLPKIQISSLPSTMTDFLKAALNDDNFMSIKPIDEIKTYLETQTTNTLDLLILAVEKVLKIIRTESKNCHNRFEQNPTANSTSEFIHEYGAYVYVTKIFVNFYNLINFVMISQRLEQSTEAYTLNVQYVRMMQATMIKLSEDLKSLQTKLQAANLEKEGLNAEVQEYVKDIDGFLQLCNKLWGKIEEINRAYHESEGNVSAHKQAQKLLIEQIKSLAEENKQNQANINAYKKALNVQKAALKSLAEDNEKYKTLDGEYKNLKQKYEMLQVLMARFKSGMLHSMNEDIAQLQEILDPTKRQSVANTSEEAGARKAQLLAGISAKLTFLADENAILQGANDKLVDLQKECEDLLKKQTKPLEAFQQAYYAMRDVAQKSMEFGFE